jgi:protein-S-isoprenylcysteine O-methyltransferase Ste14
LTSSQLEVAEYAFQLSEANQKETIMDTKTQIDNKQLMKGPLPGLLRPPLTFLAAILLGIALNHACALPFRPSTLELLGPSLTVCSVLLFLLSFWEFRAAGTSVRGSERTTAIVQTGPYRFSRNPIYLSFILLLLGLAVWLNDLWLVIMLAPAVGFIAAVVIPREEQFLDRNFHEEYLRYKTAVRRWL